MMTAPKSTSTTTRVTSFIAAAALTVGLTAVLTQALHIDRIGAPVQVVELERVTVTAQSTPAPAASVAATAATVAAY